MPAILSVWLSLVSSFIYLLLCYGSADILFIFQTIMESQKHSVAGDEITVPGATEKVSFLKTEHFLCIFFQSVSVFFFLEENKYWKYLFH